MGWRVEKGNASQMDVGREATCLITLPIRLFLIVILYNMYVFFMIYIHICISLTPKEWKALIYVSSSNEDHYLSINFLPESTFLTIFYKMELI